MALKEPYCDIACADVYLVDSAVWQSATDSQKNIALMYGAIWIDSNYSCLDLIADLENPSDNIKYANALLAEDYLEGTLYASDGTTSDRIKMKRVKAGSVESEKEYIGGTKQNYQQDVDAILQQECTKLNKGGYVLVTRR